MGQLSFYSAEATPPRLADLAGVLCGPGRATGFGAGTAARLTVDVPQRWRAVALAAACAERAVRATVSAGDDGRWLVRTAFRADLVDLAARWSGEAGAKSVPAGLTPDGATLRLWALVAGGWSETGYQLGLDPAHPGTHLPLVAALMRTGMPVALVDGGGGPSVRISRVRRLARLVELVGDPPPGVPGHDWPAVAVVAGNRGANTAVRVKKSVDGVT